MNGSTHVTAKNGTADVTPLPVKNNMVNLQELYPGESYNVSLWFDLDQERLLQCSHLLTLSGFTCSVFGLWPADIQHNFFVLLSFCFSFKLVPNVVLGLRCDYFSGGYGLAVIWDRPYGVVDVVQVEVGGQQINLSSNASPRHEVRSLQAAQWYRVGATSFSGAMKSKTESRDCQTDPRGKIRSKCV